MELFISEFIGFPAVKELNFSKEDFNLDFDSVLGLENPYCKLNIQKSDQEYFCQGTLCGNLKLECSRCLKVYSKEINTNIDFIICSKDKYEEIRKEGLDDEDYIFFAGTNLAADITPIVRQAVLLEVTMMPICSDDCRGFCTMCGANLNETECGCVNISVDPRWEVLKKLTKTDK